MGGNAQSVWLILGSVQGRREDGVAIGDRRSRIWDEHLRYGYISAETVRITSGLSASLSSGQHRWLRADSVTARVDVKVRAHSLLPRT